MIQNISVIFEDSRFGGPHSQFCNLVKNLKQKINFNILISKFESYHFKKNLKKINVNYKTANINYLSARNKFLFKYVQSFFKNIYLLKKFIEKNDTHYLYVPGGSTSIKSVIVGILLKKKIIWHIHDSHSNFFIKILYFSFSFFAYKIIFVSKKSLKYYPNFLNKKKIILLPSAVHRINRNTNSKSNFSIGMIANFNPIKNIELYLEIIKKFKKNNENVKFYLMGKIWNTQKHYYDKCINIIKKNKLYNLKIITSSSKSSFLNKLDVYICTSKSESSPLTICEALSNGLPIISTDIGDLKYFIKTKKFGYIIPNDNIDLFYKKILILKENKSLYKNFSDNASKVYNKNFNIKNYGLKFYNLI
jgi:glycosyltransferase involved in cell wall biosynthesis